MAVYSVEYRALGNDRERVRALIVYADKEGLYRAADEMIQIADVIKKLNFHIEQLVFSTCDSWQGESEQAFAEQIITINGKFDTLYAYVDRYASLLKQFANDYEDMDTGIANKINRI